MVLLCGASELVNDLMCHELFIMIVCMLFLLAYLQFTTSKAMNCLLLTVDEFLF
jgi:hypothetical protein